MGLERQYRDVEEVGGEIKVADVDDTGSDSFAIIVYPKSIEMTREIIKQLWNTF